MDIFQQVTDFDDNTSIICLCKFVLLGIEVIRHISQSVEVSFRDLV